MKRLQIAILVSLFLCLFAVPSLAENAAFETLPEQIRQLWLDEYAPDELVDALALTLPDGQTCGLLLSKGGWVNGFFPHEGGYAQLWSFSIDYLNNAGLRFVRHDALSVQPDGTPYPSGIGFDVINDEGARLTFCYLESAQAFECTGYRREKSDYDVQVAPIDEEMATLSFYQGGRACGQFRVSRSIFTLFRMWVLPSRPEEAQRLSTVSREALAARQEGYTLRWYSSDGVLEDTMVETAYSKVENGFLTVRWVKYQAGGAIISELTSFPIPLSKEFQQRLEAEPFDQLISLSYSNEFQTDDFLNTSLIPVSGSILQSSIQPHALLLLMEDEAGVRRLMEITRNENGVYALRQTPPLPKGVWMDSFHAGMEELLLEWDQQHRQVNFRRTFDGEWKLIWLTCYGEKETLNCSFGLNTGTLMDTDTLKIGVLPFDLFADDLTALPCTSEELTAQLDRTGLAVVCNPDPNDRLHLRTKPSREANSLGKFWNGTPVRVLNERDGWCQVAIGTDGRLIGWMMKKYLVTGAKMDQVTPCFSQQTLRDDKAETETPIYTDLSLKERYCTHSGWELMGVADDRLYVVVTDEGETGYAPMEWFFDGNG